MKAKADIVGFLKESFASSPRLTQGAIFGDPQSGSFG
jgi:hypothetical protein